MTAYTFNEEFQAKIVAMMYRDLAFAQRVEGLVKPEFLANSANGWMIGLANKHLAKYSQLPSPAIVVNELKAAKDAKAISDEDVTAIKDVIKFVYDKPDLSNRDYMIEAVAKFARHRAIEDALIEAAEIIDKKGDPDTIRPLLSNALDLGSDDGIGSTDFFADYEKRIDYRTALLAGTVIARTITTGFKELDDAFGGWGRRELWALMGGPKSGKSTGLSQFAVNASLVGNNVLFLTCEVSKERTADRMDACLSVTKVRELNVHPGKLKTTFTSLKAKAGLLKIHEFPTNTLRCSDIRRLLRKYQSQSIMFDLVVVDYADIMNSEQRYQDERFKLAEVYGGLRAIAQTEDLAVLTATQTNRAGAKSGTAKLTDVAEDINKARLVDGLISINANEDEKAKGEVRLYMAAVRNDEGDYSILCKTDRHTMRLISKVIGRE